MPLSPLLQVKFFLNIYVSGLLNDLPLQRSYAILKNTCVVENGSASSPEGSPIQ